MTKREGRGGVLLQRRRRLRSSKQRLLPGVGQQQRHKECQLGAMGGQLLQPLGGVDPRCRQLGGSSCNSLCVLTMP